MLRHYKTTIYMHERDSVPIFPGFALQNSSESRAVLPHKKHAYYFELRINSTAFHNISFLFNRQNARLPNQNSNDTKAEQAKSDDFIRKYLKTTLSDQIVVSIDEDRWVTSPTLKPEDELMLRQLQELMQTTTNELKQLSKKFNNLSSSDNLPQKPSQEASISESTSSNFKKYDKKCKKRSQRYKSQKISSHQTKYHTYEFNPPYENKNAAALRVSKIDVSSQQQFKKGCIQENKNSSKNLTVQELPIIEIKRELKEQCAVMISISPISNERNNDLLNSMNTVVLEMHHEHERNDEIEQKKTDIPPKKVPNSVRNSVSHKTLNTQNNQLRSPQNPSNLCSKLVRTELRTNELNKLYGQSGKSTLQKKAQSNLRKTKSEGKKTEFVIVDVDLKPREYIPYSKLTLGGVEVDDIEKEISECDYKADLPLSPIVDKILSSRESSAQVTPRSNVQNNIVEVCDDYLIKDVLQLDRDIYNVVSRTSLKPYCSKNDDTDSDFHFRESLSESIEKRNKYPKNENSSNYYQEDFDCSKSLQTSKVSTQGLENISEKPKKSSPLNVVEIKNSKIVKNRSLPTLNLQKRIEVFEYIHSVPTNEHSTQISNREMIVQKETQTSPKLNNEIDCGDQEKLQDKDFIRNFILEEYGDLNELQKNLCKLSDNSCEINVSVQPKNTQTSPIKTKNVTTSPQKLKKEITLELERQPSPIHIRCQEDNDSIDIGITVNMASPRLHLKLPYTCSDVFKHFDNNAPRTSMQEKGIQVQLSSSAASDTNFDGSDTDVTSLGEVSLQGLQNNLMNRNKAISDVSSESQTTVSDECIELIPNKSEGEISIIEQVNSSIKNKEKRTL